MMEKKKRKLYKMFTKWSLSYVIISTLAIAVISFCAMKYSEALREDLEYTNAVQLEMTQLQMDRNVRNLRIFCNKANFNKTVKRLRKKTSYEDESRYELYELVRELANEMILEGNANDCYLYFPNMDLLVSGNYYNDSREFYDIAFDGYGFSYDDWFEVISKDYKTSQIFSLDTKNGDSLTVLIKPLDSSNRQTPPANAIMVMDVGKILKASDWLNQDRDNMCIIDRTNKRLVSVSPMEEEMSNKLLERALESQPGEFQTRFEVGSSVISYIHSQYENWDYAVITQEQAYVMQISELRNTVALLILLYLAVSAIAIGYAAIRHYWPLKNMVDILEQQDGADAQMSTDAYDYISKSVHKLVVKNKENNSVINKQRNAISRELFHRLLTESGASAMMDEELLKQYGIRVEEGACCILVYRMEKNVEFLPEEMQVDTQEMSWFILQNVTEENLAGEELESVCFREGRWELVFLIWPEKENEEFLEAVKRVCLTSSEFIQEHFKLSYQTALSELHYGLEESHKAYREARTVFDYQKKEESKDIISYGEINLLPVDTLLKYPIDVENRLVHSISSGDGEEACREIKKLLVENQVNCLTPAAMQFLVSNIASSIIRAAGKASHETSIPVSSKALMEACRRGDAVRMQEELENLVMTTCQKITEINKKERENQKGRLLLDVKAYVEEYYSDAELSVASMAEQFHVPPAYLSKLFKELEGEKLSQYIHKIRLVHVKERLLADDRLEDIAVSCGFGSHRTFLRIFKQYEGLTPTQYKELEEKKRKEEQDS